MSSTDRDFALAHHLREARLRKGLDQATLARAVGVTHQTISAVENGRQELGAAKFVRWARACDASLEWLAEDVR